MFISKASSENGSNGEKDQDIEKLDFEWFFAFLRGYATYIDVIDSIWFLSFVFQFFFSLVALYLFSFPLIYFVFWKCVENVS